MVARAIAVWLVLITVESINGIARTLLLVPWVGDFRARQIGVLIGSVSIQVIAYLLVPWICARDRKALMGVGVLWLGLTLAFELGFGHWVFGRTWERLGSDLDLAHGGLLPLGFVVLVFSPLMGVWLRERMN